MTVRFRFQLRTLFLITTVIAVCVGLRLGVSRLLGYQRGESDVLDDILSVHVWGDVPFFLVCVLGAKWVFEQPASDSTAKRFALIALVVTVFWDFIGHLILAHSFPFLAILGGSIEDQMFYLNIQILLAHFIKALCWLLMILAYLRQGKLANA